MNSGYKTVLKVFVGFLHNPLNEYARWPKIPKTRSNNKYIQPHVCLVNLKL